MAAWLRMVATVMVVLLPGGLVFLLAFVFGRTWHRAVKDAAATGGALERDPWFAWKALLGIRLPDVWREARRIYAAAPIRAA